MVSGASAAALVLLLGGTWFLTGRRQLASGPTVAQQPVPPPAASAPGPSPVTAPTPPRSGPMIAAAPPRPAQPPADPFAGGPPTVGAGPPPLMKGDRDTTVGSAGPGSPRRFATVLGDLATLRDTLERTGRLASLSPNVRSRVSADLERGRNLRDLTAISFPAGTTKLRRDQAAQLAPAIAARTSPALALVVLGYANEGNRADRNIAVSRQCAESVASAIRQRGGVTTVPVYWFAMGDGTGLLGTRREGGRRFVEIWAIDP